MAGMCDSQHYGLGEDTLGKYRPPDPISAAKSIQYRTRFQEDASSDPRYMERVYFSQQPENYRYTMMSSTERPKPSYQARAMPSKDFRCDNGFFMNAQRPYRNSFVIHPEWVSETSLSKKKAHMTSTKGPAGLRYGAKC